MKVAARRFVPRKLTGRTKFAGLTFVCVLILVSSVVGAFALFSIWPFSSDQIHRGSITEVPSESVTYQTEDGVGIVAGWFVPQNKKSPPVVVLLHEQGGTRAQWNPLIPVLVSEGYAVLAPDLRGFGESTTVVRDGKEEPYQFTNRQDALRDVAAALKWLKDQREVDAGRVGVIGARLGGDLAYVSTGLFPEVKAAVAITTTRFETPNADPLFAAIPDYAAHDVCFMAGGRQQWEDAVSLGIRTVSPGGRHILEHPDLDGVALLAVDEPIRNILGWLDARLRRDGHEQTNWCSANA